jgi:rod shape-determining protein MreD
VIILENKFHLIFYPAFIFVTILILIFQGSFLSFFFAGGSIPDLLLIIVLCLTFLGGEKRGMLIGIIAGFLQDIIFGPALGFFSLAKMLSAFLAGLASREIYRDQIIGPALTVFLITFFHEMIIFLLVGLFWGGNNYNFYYALKNLFLPRALYHFILTIPIYPLLYRAEQKNFFYPFFK